MELQPARLRLAAGLVAALLAAGCGDAAAPGTSPAGCADVVAVELRPEPVGTYEVVTTVRSADTGWEKYADAWQVVAPDGAVLGTRELAHPHVDEQPFTRSLRAVAIPPGVAELTVRARDSVAGWCGEEVTATVPPPP